MPSVATWSESPSGPSAAASAPRSAATWVDEPSPRTEVTTPDRSPPRSGASRPEARDAEDPRTDPVTRTLGGTASAAQLIQRLTRDLAILDANDGWTALALPRGSDEDRVQEALRRMQERYAPLAAHAHPEVAALARRVLERTVAAVGELANGEGPGRPPVEAMMRVGRQLVDRSDWRGAARHFSRMRELLPNEAMPLAWLAWAVYHDPEEVESTRVEESRTLLDLALLFQPRSVDAHLFHAAIAADVGELDEAQRHLYEVFAQDPTHREALRIARRITEQRGLSVTN
jgi:hypothetical protein